MDDKEFRKLKREDLIEIIYQYQRREQKLVQENEVLRRQLQDRNIKMNKAGSIAEAALALNGVFEAAQKAADQYLETVRNMAQPQANLQEPAAPAANSQTAAVPERKPAAPVEIPGFNPSSRKRPEAPEKPNFQNIFAAQPAKTDSQQQTSEKPEAPQQIPSEAAKPTSIGNPEQPAASKPAAAKASVQVQRPAPKPAAAPAQQNASPKPNPADDTDAFISSLKDYLGM